jgi:carbamoylphosphate synthase small subunit
VRVAFVRTKTIKGIDYRYLVEGVRDGGKVHQRVVAYLGAHKSVKAAHAHWVREARKQQGRAAKRHAQQMVKTLKQYL